MANSTHLPLSELNHHYLIFFWWRGKYCVRKEYLKIFNKLDLITSFTKVFFKIYFWRQYVLLYKKNTLNHILFLVLCSWISFILLCSEVRVFCLKLKISITTEQIGNSILGSLHIGFVMVLAFLCSDFSLGMV